MKTEAVWTTALQGLLPAAAASLIEPRQLRVSQPGVRDAPDR
jgi:hypothetical protein